jgi:hypothetical protein
VPGAFDVVSGVLSHRGLATGRRRTIGTTNGVGPRHAPPPTNRRDEQVRRDRGTSSYNQRADAGDNAPGPSEREVRCSSQRAQSRNDRVCDDENAAVHAKVHRCRDLLDVSNRDVRAGRRRYGSCECPLPMLNGKSKGPPSFQPDTPAPAQGFETTLRTRGIERVALLTPLNSAQSADARLRFLEPGTQCSRSANASHISDEGRQTGRSCLRRAGGGRGHRTKRRSDRGRGRLLPIQVSGFAIDELVGRAPRPRRQCPNFTGADRAPAPYLCRDTEHDRNSLAPSELELMQAHNRRARAHRSGSTAATNDYLRTSGTSLRRVTMPSTSQRSS